MPQDAKANNAPGIPVPKSTVLVIDDEQTWRNLLGKTLSAADYNVYSAASCADGIKMASLHKPDCILLDFHLGDGTAADVCLSIRSTQNIKKTPIVIFSSDPQAAISAYTQCQADKFITKDTPLTELFLILNDILKRRVE